jgi:SNF2 family DNA or RNA helicase
MQIIDNINTLLGNELKQSLTPKSKLKVAASCFSMYAFVALKKELSNIESLEFIFTEATFTPESATDKFKKEHREFHIQKTDRERSLYGSDFEVQLKNELTQKAVAKECAEWIRRKVTFKSNTSDSAMQQFITTQDKAQDETVFAPISGFTAVDLGYQKGSAVSSLSHKFDQAPFTQQYLTLFDQIWLDDDKLADVTEQVIQHIDSVYQENSPEKIYFLILYNIFHEFLDEMNEDVLANDRTGYQDTVIWDTLFNYQQDAATGIINKLEMYNGCILADSVGLGKTFTALAVMKYYELRNKSVLLLCPKKLADNWLTYNRNVTTNILVKDRFNYDVLCHTDLSRTRGESFGMPLNQINWGNYDLVVIDESHNFRNDNAVKDRETRYQKLMNKVIRSGVKTKVLMLSATPVNNRFSDLRNQLALAYEGQSENLTKNLKTTRSVEDIFKRAQRAFNDWSELPPEDRTPKAILDLLDIDFFELLDSVTIARSRKHIEAFYDTTDIGKFPDRLPPKSFHCPLTMLESAPPSNEIFNQLRQLKMCVYAPISYVLPSRLKKYEELYDTEVSGGRGKLTQQDREKALVALMTTNLLKRLESSVYAFRKTLSKLKSNLDAVLVTIDEFHQKGGVTEIDDIEAAMGLIDSYDDDSFQDMEVGGKVKIQLQDMDLISWEQDLRVDLTMIESLLTEMQAITPEYDAKLQHLQAHIADKQAKPINTGNKKVIIFTAFADTAQYLYEQLAPTLWSNHQIHSAMITGGSGLPKNTLKTGKRGYDVQETLTLFAPISKSKAAVLPEEPNEIDILIATDCISEGQNLQDCDYLINYDIHWNPVRIVQRFGRVDRIGSPNNVIQLVNYWPDITLDEYINLKERVESRMVIVDAAGVAGDNILLEKQNELAYRKDQLKRLQEETLDLEDLKTGVSITDLGLNDFRMDLMSYVEKYGEPKNVANGLHTVVPANPERGLEQGVIFALKNINSAVNIDQQNRLHPYYLIYISNQGEIIADHLEVKRLLDLVRSSCINQEAPVREVCDIFNRLTQDGRQMQEYSQLLSQAISSMIATKDESDIDSLFSSGETSALVNSIKGLDDFELLAFIVVQSAESVEST